jgi:hypothetical protein
MFIKRNTAVYFLQGASSPSPQIPLPAIGVARLILSPPKRCFASFSDYRYLRLISENLPDILLKMDV